MYLDHASAWALASSPTFSSAKAPPVILRRGRFCVDFALILWDKKVIEEGESHEVGIRV